MSPARTWHMAACMAPLCSLKPLGSGQQMSSIVTQKLCGGCALAIPNIQRDRGDSEQSCRSSLANLQLGLGPAVASSLLNSRQSWIFSWGSRMAPQEKWWQPCWLTALTNPSISPPTTPMQFRPLPVFLLASWPPGISMDKLAMAVLGRWTAEPLHSPSYKGRLKCRSGCYPEG